MRRGKFIVVDGCEGAGKTTLLNHFLARSKRKNIIVTHEPGGTGIALKIRELFLSDFAKEASAETQFGLVWAARADHMKNKIIPVLKAGKTVLCDRFDSSTYAYQIYARGAKNLENVFWKTREAFLGKYKPDLYIFLDVDPKIGLERVERRKNGRINFDNYSLAFHKKVKAGFLKFIKRVAHKIIDANQCADDVLKEFQSYYS